MTCFSLKCSFVYISVAAEYQKFVQRKAHSVYNFEKAVVLKVGGFQYSLYLGYSCTTEGVGLPCSIFMQMGHDL